MLGVESWYRRASQARQASPDKPAADAPPLVLTAEANGARFVAAADHAALAGGIASGMALADARALEPGLKTAPADPAADAAMLDKLAAWCGRYTPWVALCGRDGLWLDISGCAHLFGGEAALMADLTERFAGFGFTPRLGLADTPGAAWALAHYGNGQEHRSVAPGAQRAALASLPVAALRLKGMQADELTRLGLATIGDLYPLPRASLAARFGRRLGERLDQALGRMAEPISPRRPRPRYRADRAFAEPIGRQEDIEASLLLLLDEICAALDRAGQGARQLILDLFLVDGRAETLRIGTARPAREAERLARLFTEPLGQIDAGFGIEVIALSVPVAEPLAASQIGALAAEGENGAASLAPLLDRLGNRLGFERVTALAPQASHVPERAMRETAAVDAGAQDGWPETPLRPLRLLERPEAIEVIAGVAPHQPPSLFRWRKVKHTVRVSQGPERIAPEWWRRDKAWIGGLRDYWRVEDCDGRRFWLYCEGSGEGGRDGRAGPLRWYLHGLFA